MGRKKVEMKYIENRNSRQVTFSKRRAGIFKKADTLARLCNVEVAVLINSPAGRPHVFGSPCFNYVAGRFQNPYPRRPGRSSSSSLKEARILKSRAKLDHLMEELERHKEHEKVLKKRLEETLENYDVKKIIDLKLEELAAFKEMLEAVRDNMKRKHMEMEALSSLLVLSKNKNKKKKNNNNNNI